MEIKHALGGSWADDTMLQDCHQLALGLLLGMTWQLLLSGQVSSWCMLMHQHHHVAPDNAHCACHWRMQQQHPPKPCCMYALHLAYESCMKHVLGHPRHPV